MDTQPALNTSADMFPSLHPPTGKLLEVQELVAPPGASYRSASIPLTPVTRPASQVRVRLGSGRLDAGSGSAVQWAECRGCTMELDVHH